jgi:hypothetical protein
LVIHFDSSYGFYIHNYFWSETMSEEHDPHKAVDYILLNAKHFAKAKAERTALEYYVKSLKSRLMIDSGQKVISAQERDAYAHEDYKLFIDGIKAATEIEEKLRWDLKAAELRVEIWRTEQANARQEFRVTV